MASLPFNPILNCAAHQALTGGKVNIKTNTPNEAAFDFPTPYDSASNGESSRVKRQDAV